MTEYCRLTGVDGNEAIASRRVLLPPLLLLLWLWLRLLQEPDFGDEDDEWQDVPGAAGVSSAAGAAAAGSSQGGGSLMSAVLEEEDDMEEWEDV